MATLLIVQERPLFSSGGLTRTLPTHATPGVPVILVDSEQSDQEKAVTVWHEVVHLMKSAGGDSQDEGQVEQFAQRLAGAFPEVLDWVGIKKNEK